MEPLKTTVLGTEVSRLGFTPALDACALRATQCKGGYVCFANVHTVTESLSDPALQEALNHSFLSVADGVPLVWASRLLGQPIQSRVCGPDFMAEFLRRFPDFTHGFLGGSPGQAEALVQLFRLNQTVTYCPPFRPFAAKHAQEDWSQLISRSPQTPQIVWVGLGAPKQELWMASISKNAPETLFFGVGAAFDFLTGSKARAPLWMQQSGLEWLFRLTREPGRLWKRYLITNVRFLWCLGLTLCKR
jgi:N-acetylglucosaminyldiphosphoundecaprenol N-acetyl-beta-D-mannosaminyltransferase